MNDCMVFQTLGFFPFKKLNVARRIATIRRPLHTGEAEEEGYADDYTLEDLDLSMLDFIPTTNMPNFRKVWDGLPEESERVDDYGLGTRESLEEAVEAVMNILVGAVHSHTHHNHAPLTRRLF